MTHRIPGFRSVIIAWSIAIFFLAFNVTLLHASSDLTSGQQNPKWVRPLPATSCPWSSSDTYCHLSSPALADITGDGKQEIVVGTNNGYVLVYRHDGSLVWQKDIGPAFGMSAGKQRIASSPAVADIDRDGKMEVVVGAGTIHGTICTQGGVIVLEHNGSVKAGWPFKTYDNDVPPAGCADSVFSTPALGDMDMDGDLEIVFGAFDKRLYALHHDGQLVSGFPPDSYHYARFGWDNLKDQLADTIWSSPALADFNNDGYLEIVIGSDEGSFANTFPGGYENWSCPYRVPYSPDRCGGSIYAFDRNGQLLEGFPRYKYEIIQSTPAVIDINGDGLGEIFIGTGTFHHRNSPDKPTQGFRLYGLDQQGNDLPGWQGGKVVGGSVPASPSIGDITGDGLPNIVVAAEDKRLYAWHANGQLVSGFPMTPRTHFDQVLDPYDTGTTFILADFTGDGKMEIFLRHAWEIVIVDGRGQQLTAVHPQGNRPYYYTDGPLWNNPAVGDLDGDGHLELVVQNSKLTVWDLPTSSALADWPMFKLDAARGGAQEPVAKVITNEIFLFAEVGQGAEHEQSVIVFGRLGKFDWKVRSNQPTNITFPQTTGIMLGKEEIGVNVRVPSGLPLGDHTLGVVEVEVSHSGSVEMTDSVPVKVRVVNQLSKSFLPLVR
ncbi:MAG: VCBS repeat-containing protein [Anaerolineaceae bacterium]|nr:MAG: VCBS repeat-containing protein [Anaerolineaceae bacterium]